jgi:dUTP pyrophosphatase
MTLMCDVLKLLRTYDKVMSIKIYVEDDDMLKQKYCQASKIHNEKITGLSDFFDAGFDLFANEQKFYGPGWIDASPVNKVDYKIKCRASMHTDKYKSYNTGYYLHPRSSLSKTPLRLANSTGIIDSGYTGRIMAMFDVVNITDKSYDTECDYVSNKYDRFVQICAPGLVPILVEVVESEHELGITTQRGTGGFGSTGR